MSSVAVTQKSLTMTQIKDKAKLLGINAGKMKKVELIHAIQVAEGCTPCYGRSNGSCPWAQCCWRGDCSTNKA
jgi:hypothetical protein